MRLSWGHLLAGALLACTASCSGSPELQPQGEIFNGPAINASIAFEQEGTLTLAPGEIVTLSVTTEPPERYAISFYLLGAALDATLDDATVLADGGGRATVSLTAPNGATSFVVRATIKDGPSAELPVSVSAEGFGTLDIHPSYGGKRDIEVWEAFVMSGTTCAALAPTFPAEPEGALTASAPPSYPLLVENAPVGPNLSVFVRAGAYAWGCADEPGLTAGAKKKLEVKIVNKPVVTSEADLDVEMTLAPDEAAWQTIIDSQRALMLDAFFAQQSTTDMLLAEMSALSGDPTGFDDASLQFGWPAELQSHLVAHQVDISATLDGWLASGLAIQPAEIQGYLKGQANGYGRFTITTFVGLEPHAIGAPDEYTMPLKVDPDDTVRFGGTFLWQPSLHLGTTIENQALVETLLPDFESALADVVACDELALSGYSGCSNACMQQLCADALATRWQHALDVSATQQLPADLPFEASGPARIDDDARLIGFDGSWLGNIVVGTETAKVAGAIGAVPAATPTQ